VLRQVRSIYLYLGLGSALAIGAILAVIVIAAQRENASSRATQEAVVRFETEHLLSALAGKLTTMVYWQDAYDKAATSWDEKWVDYQFGPYLDSININVVAIFDAQGRLLFSYTHGLQNPPRRALIATNENVRELFAAALKLKSIRPPVVKTATIDIDGTAYFAVAGFITPETDAQMPIPAANKRVVLFLTRASTASYATLENSFGVADLKIARNIADTSGFVSVSLRDAANDVATRVWWRPMRPGLSFLRLTVPLSVLVFFLLAAVQALIIRRWQSLQRALFKAEATAQSAREESHAKSAFLGTISHELRTPLNAIIGFSDLLLQQIFGSLGSPRYQEYAGYIQSSGRSLLGKVNDLIEIARIEARDTAMEHIPTDAGALMQDALRNLREAAQEKGIAIVVATDSPSLWCRAAPLSLIQVLTRVLDNAIKFSHEGGTIEIGVRNEASDIAIAIRDHGAGIAADQIETLGAPFVQVEGHMTRKNGGVGLGLAISKGLMRLMQGELTIESESGAGTTVTIRLPSVSSPHEAQKEAA
jgi:signal transduction histidine kinase